MNVENSMNYEKSGHLVIVYFHGEIDCVNAPVYRQELVSLLDETDEDVVFNFKDTSFIDSSGIGLVLGRYNQLKFDHRTLILTGLNQVAYRLFELTGLFQIMPYYESIDELKEGTLWIVWKWVLVQR